MKIKRSTRLSNESKLSNDLLQRILSIQTKAVQPKLKRLPNKTSQPGDEFLSMIQKIKRSKPTKIILQEKQQQAQSNQIQQRKQVSVKESQRDSFYSKEFIQEKLSSPFIQQSQSEQEPDPLLISPTHLQQNPQPKTLLSVLQTHQPLTSDPPNQQVKSDKQEKQRKHAQLLKLLETPSSKVLVYKLSKLQNLSYERLKQLFGSDEQTMPFVCLVYPSRDKKKSFFKKQENVTQFLDYTPAPVTQFFYFPKRIQHRLSNNVSQFQPTSSNISLWVSKSSCQLSYAISLLWALYQISVDRLFQDKGRTHNRFVRYWIYEQGWKLRSSDKVWHQALQEQLGKKRVQQVIQGLSGAAVKSIRLQKQSSRMQELLSRHARSSEVYKQCERLICHNKFQSKKHIQVKQSKTILLQGKTETLFRLQEGRETYWVKSSAFYQQFDSLFILHLHPHFTFLQIEVPSDKLGVKHFYWNMHIRTDSYLHIDFKEKVNCRLYQQVFRGQFEQKNKLYLKSIVLTLNAGNFIFVLQELPGHVSFKFTIKISSRPLVKLGSTLNDLPDSSQLARLFQSVYRQLGTPIKQDSPKAHSRRI